MGKGWDWDWDWDWDWAGLGVREREFFYHKKIYTHIHIFDGFENGDTALSIRVLDKDSRFLDSMTSLEQKSLVEDTGLRDREGRVFHHKNIHILYTPRT